MPGKGLIQPHGTHGGARGGLGSPDSWDGNAGCPDAARPGLTLWEVGLE